MLLASSPEFSTRKFFSISKLINVAIVVDQESYEYERPFRVSLFGTYYGHYFISNNSPIHSLQLNNMCSFKCLVGLAVSVCHCRSRGLEFVF